MNIGNEISEVEILLNTKTASPQVLDAEVRDPNPQTEQTTESQSWGLKHILLIRTEILKPETTFSSTD